MGFPGFDDLQHALQNTDHGAERPIFTLGEAAQTTEMAEQLIGAVDEMNDHTAALCREAHSRAHSAWLTMGSRANRVSYTGRCRCADYFSTATFRYASPVAKSLPIISSMLKTLCITLAK